MNRTKALFCGIIPAIGAILVGGCQTTSPRADVRQIPQITKLVEQVTAPPRVHRFRKPLRDEQARLLRQLSIECDRLAGSYDRVGVSAEALTGSIPEPSPTTSAEAGSLEAALAQLASAARRGDVRAIRSKHTAALTAYARVPSRTAPPDS